MAGTVVAFRWRTIVDEPTEQWRRDFTKLASDETVADLRRRLELTRGSTASLASAHDPELWHCDEEGAPVQRVELRAVVLLGWTAASFPQEWLAVHPTGEPRAVLVFTFPPAAPVGEVQSLSAQERAQWLALIRDLTADPGPLVANSVIRLSPAAAAVTTTSPPLTQGIFVRPCYLTLMQRVRERYMEAQPTASASRALVSGTAGIGKSTLLMLVARERLLEGKRVVLHDYKLAKVVLLRLHPTPSVELFKTIAAVSSSDFDVYLTDAPSPLVHNVETVAALSPWTKETLFSKSSDHFYMPVWSREELRACNDLLRLVRPQVMDANFLRWGGIARYVFASETTSQMAMDEAITKAAGQGLQHMFQLLAQASAASPLVDRLVHIIPDDDFGPGHRQVASYGVFARLSELFLNQLRNGELRLLLESSQLANAGALRGNVFAAYTHRFFVTSAGSRFVLQRLLARGRVDVAPPAPKRRRGDRPSAVQAEAALDLSATLRVQRFWNLDELRTDGVVDCVYYLPNTRSLAAADAFMLAGGVLYLFQDTISRTHDIVGPGVLAITALLRGSADVSFVFRVPSTHATSFQRQRVVKNRQGDVYEKPPALLRDLAQFVLAIPLGGFS